MHRDRWQYATHLTHQQVWGAQGLGPKSKGEREVHSIMVSLPNYRDHLRFLNRMLWRKVGRAHVLALLVLVGVMAAGCANGSYPLDIFYEMHYQQTYQSHEPPRLSAPEGAVPITGRGVLLTENPIPGQRIEEGARLFAANCAFCHGMQGKGDGPVLRTMKEKYNYGTDERPYTITPDLTDDFVKNQADVAVFAWITNGVTVMPPFNKLLTMEERWLLVNYIRSLSE